MNYKKLYDSIIENPNRGNSQYTEKHHIIPRCLGGTDDPGNLVKLSAREHYLCHWLLTKIYPSGRNHYKLIRAFWMMHVTSSTHGERHLNSRVYESLRKQMSAAMSDAQSGNKNSNYGYVWIHNRDIRESKRIKKLEPIPEGWMIGRVLNWDLKVESPQIRLEKKQALDAKRDAKNKKIRIKKKHKNIRASKEYREAVTRKIYKRFVSSGLSLRGFAKSENLVAMTLSKWFREHIEDYGFLSSHRSVKPAPL